MLEEDFPNDQRSEPGTPQASHDEDPTGCCLAADELGSADDGVSFNRCECRTAAGSPTICGQLSY